jgi:hypothetical protein
MNDIAKQSCIERLKKAMDLEKMTTGDTARHLNLNPCYISMALNEKSWVKLPKSSWERLILWCNSGSTLSHFKIPEGEEIWVSEKNKAFKALANEIKKSLLKEPEIDKTIAQPAPEMTETDKSFRGIMEEHDKRVIERNEMDREPEQVKYELKEVEPARIPITLDLKINIQVCLFGKTINIPLP